MHVCSHSSVQKAMLASRRLQHATGCRFHARSPAEQPGRHQPHRHEETAYEENIAPDDGNGHHAHHGLRLLTPCFLQQPELHSAALSVLLRIYLRVCQANEQAPDATLIAPLLPYLPTQDTP